MYQFFNINTSIAEAYIVAKITLFSAVYSTILIINTYINASFFFKKTSMLFLFKTWFYDRWPVVNQSIIYQFNAIALNSPFYNSCFGTNTGTCRAYFFGRRGPGKE